MAAYLVEGGMLNKRIPIVIRAVLGLLPLLAACSRYDVIPSRYEQQINRSLTFEQIQSAPRSHIGELVVWGGEVLSTARVEDRTRLELRQLPLTKEHIPIMDGQPDRRFFAFQHNDDRFNPAALKKGALLTIVGEVTGSMKEQVGEADYQYPTVEIKNLTAWGIRRRRRTSIAIHTMEDSSPDIHHVMTMDVSVIFSNASCPHSHSPFSDRDL